MKREPRIAETWFRMTPVPFGRRVPLPVHWKGWSVYLLGYGGMALVVFWWLPDLDVSNQNDALAWVTVGVLMVWTMVMTMLRTG
jgi:hypothetical protein